MNNTTQFKHSIMSADPIAAKRKRAQELQVEAAKLLEEKDQQSIIERCERLKNVIPVPIGFFPLPCEELEKKERQAAAGYTHKAVDTQGSDAHTLDADEVSWSHHTSMRAHEDGWVIRGDIQEDYYHWVNDFQAWHRTYGYVWGDFEDTVWADSKAGYDHFCTHHPVNHWDYGDI